MNFIYFHYLTPRNDSNFWKTFREKNQVLPFIEKLSEICEENIPEREVYEYLTSMENVRIGCQNVLDTNIFSRDSWLQVGSGIRFFSKDIAAKEFEQNFKYYKPSLDMIELHKHNNLDLLKHNQHLQNIKEKNNV